MHERRDFQNLAHFALPAGRGCCSGLGRGQAERLPEGIAQVAVARETQLERERAQVCLPLREPSQRLAQPQPVAVLMDAEATLRTK